MIYVDKIVEKYTPDTLILFERYHSILLIK